MWDAAGNALASAAMFNMVVSLVFIAISWWALQVFKFDLFIRNVNSVQAKLLQLLLSVFIGHGVASFFIEYLNWTTMLRYIF
ncbi:DUF1146 family protein [Bacillus horti]|uniref:Integral membrane protein (TIGR02327 family) n=1 Tax=Caldalkalibacillus horti TaxID=77523 RepID=A0ABT9VZK8_9BACI|nr:DUF1146 family protein [Bacillus horti]MDQ0166438.1 putative integral membrane protein (TIGR02327 family) [Bacillus horti]